VLFAAWLACIDALALPTAQRAAAPFAALLRRGPVRCCDVPDEVDDLSDIMLEIEADAPPPGEILPVDIEIPTETYGLSDGEWSIRTEGDLNVLLVMVAGKVLRFENGVMGRLASGSVNLVVGATHVFSTACLERPRLGGGDIKPASFTPLRVDYFERTSAVGQTKGGYIKRDGRPSDHETLIARLIDRPIRPLIAEGWSCETQLVSYVLAYDLQHLPDVLAVCSASAALAISEVPFPKPVAAVRVALVDGKFLVNPTSEELGEAPELDMVIAGTKEAVMMVEGEARFVPEEQVIEALSVGLAAIATIASAIEAWGAEIGAAPFEAGTIAAPPGLAQRLADLPVPTADGEKRLEEALPAAMTLPGTKLEREAAVDEIYAVVMRRMCKGEGEGEGLEPVDEAFVKNELKKLACKAQRSVVSASGLRADGRTTDEVRPISIAMKPLPQQVHGSVLFTRGETQSLATATLGGDKMQQRYEDLEGEHSKRFYLQYSFPPFSVGEVGRIGTPGRREVGHGNLAERALRPALPPEAEFKYTVRVESLITESCGSSSMASVCGGCLAMVAAGVPLTRRVAGVAMGLLLDESGEGGAPIILTDILGSEDALGTMDFKVAGDTVGISAFQLDIKCEGLSLPLMSEALEQARLGRLHILGVMEEASSPDEPVTLPPGVPRLFTLEVSPSAVGRIIGPGGANINAIIADTGVDAINIDKAAPGQVVITGKTDEALQAAAERVRESAGEGSAGGGGRAPPPPPSPPIAVDDVFEAVEIKNIVPFGLFVSLQPGKDGFCHISELSEEYIRDIKDVELSVGDKVDVTVTEINNKGRYRVSIDSEFGIRSSRR